MRINQPAFDICKIYHQIKVINFKNEIETKKDTNQWNNKNNTSEKRKVKKIGKTVTTFASVFLLIAAFGFLIHSHLSLLC